MAALEPRATFNPWTETTPASPPSSSIPAQVAAKLVARHWPEHSEALHHRLLAAYFAEQRDISDARVLAEVAAEVDVDAAEFAALFAEEARTLTEAVIAEHNGAIAQGVTGVPTVVMNGFGIPGAQETESYLIWISRLLERRNE